MDVLKIKKKKYAMGLIRAGFDLIKAESGKDYSLEWVFERNEDILKRFDELVSANRVYNRLSQFEIRCLIGLLEGHEMDEDVMFTIMHKLEEMDKDFERKNRK